PSDRGFGHAQESGRARHVVLAEVDEPFSFAADRTARLALESHSVIVYRGSVTQLYIVLRTGSRGHPSNTAEEIESSSERGREMKKLAAIGTLLLSSAAVFAAPAVAVNRNAYTNQTVNHGFAAPAPAAV